MTTGFNLGGIIGPLLFGLLLDLGDPSQLFWAIALLSLLTLVVIYATGALGQRRGARLQPAAERGRCAAALAEAPRA